MCYENGIPQHKFSCLKEFSSMNLIGEHCQHGIMIRINCGTQHSLESFSTLIIETMKMSFTVLVVRLVATDMPGLNFGVHISAWLDQVQPAIGQVEGKYNVLAQNMTEDGKMSLSLAKNIGFCCHNGGWKISRRSLKLASSFFFGFGLKEKADRRLLFGSRLTIYHATTMQS